MFSYDSSWDGSILVTLNRWLSFFSKSPEQLQLQQRESKIVGGRDAVPGEYPHQVCIRAVEIPKGKVTISGGSLISSNHVLTAAHCLDQVDYVILTFGSVRPTITGCAAIRYGTRSSFTIHPQFNSRTLKNDIAIIRLDRPVPLGYSSIRTVRLPRVGRMSPFFYEGKEGIVAGWGSTSAGCSSMSRTLQCAKVKVRKQHLSRSWYDYWGYNLQNSQLSTDFRAFRTGTAGGDSGGPLLMRESDGRPTLIGIISFGAVNCESDSPSVYTSVAMYVPWIKSQTGIPLRKRIPTPKCLHHCQQNMGFF